MDPLSIKVTVIPTIRNPEVDPEVNLEADHPMGLAVLLPEVTESTLATGLMPMTGVEIRTIGQIVAHIKVMIVTSTAADIMTGVMSGGMTTEVDTGLHVGVLFIDLQTIPGLMTTIQMT